MSFFTRLFSSSKPAPPRRILDVMTMQVKVASALAGATQSNYRDIWTKEVAAVCEKADIEAASKTSFMPWAKNHWECEDQARALLDSLQRTAANAGHTRAAGLLFADPPQMFPDAPRHVYIFAIIGTTVTYFDPTAQVWCERPKNIYFTLL